MLTMDKLNSTQRAAAAWVNGPLLVLAGPGSGKTAVLTVRIARILREDPDATVLALTFTNKAAAEMRERVDGLMAAHADRAHLCTFHSYATDILRQHGSHIGLRPDFTLLTQEEDRVSALRRIVEEDQGRTFPDRLDLRSLLGLLDRLFRESYGGEPKIDVDGLTNPPSWLPHLFKCYSDLALAENRLDFGALLHMARKLLDENRDIVLLQRKIWSHFCVDEFQDTNRAQYDLLKLVVGDNEPNLFVVADDDQIIYQWNGASPERLQALRNDYGMMVIQLPVNFRCPSEIISLANSLIQHNRQRSPNKEPLVAIQQPAVGEVIRTGHYQDEDDESAAIARDIGERRVRPDHCVVLARTTKLLGRAATALKQQGIDAYVVQRKDEFVEAPVRLAYNLLRLANYRHDRDVLRRVCVAWENLSRRTIEVDDLEAASMLKGGDFLRTFLEAAVVGGLTLPLVGLIDEVNKKLADGGSFLSFVDWFIDAGWGSWKGEADGGGDTAVADEVEAWAELHRCILDEHGRENVNLNLYIQYADMHSKATPHGGQAVRCMTIHGAKGLEFRHVYLIGMAEDVCPSYFARQNGSHSKEMEEERRNCFVAITRAQETLTLTWARTYNGWSKQPSRFLREMGLVPV